MQSTQVPHGDEIFGKGTLPYPIYFSFTLNKYVDLRNGATYTEEEMAALDAMESAWRASIPSYSFYELMDIYGPECFTAAKRGITARLKKLKEEEVADAQWFTKFKREIIEKIGDYDQKIATREYTTESYKERQEARTNKVKKLKHYLSFIKRAQEKEKARKQGIELPDDDGDKINEEDVAQAKEVPIETVFPTKLRKMGNRAIGLCPIHNEKTPSFTVYLKTNTWHCFGCHEGRDVVDLVMKLQGVEFLQAVKILLNRV